MTETGTFTLAVVQCELGGTADENLDRLEHHIAAASRAGANVILTPELITGPYFCQTQREDAFRQAYATSNHPAVSRYEKLARDFDVVLPCSVFEKDGPNYYNTLVMLDAGGDRLGSYRKSHIPDGPGYQEKFYFRPGNTGFRVWQTRFARLGAGICWDQWFPEAARAMALQGAQALLYPTAIGSEPQDPSLETSGRWQRAMQGHAVSNTLPVAAANRIGQEADQVFYGCSFITDETGEKIAEVPRGEEGFVLSSFDPARLAQEQAAWGFFRDRRPDLYGALTET